jgi:hypothetical protein
MRSKLSPKTYYFNSYSIDAKSDHTLVRALDRPRPHTAYAHNESNQQVSYVDLTLVFHPKGPRTPPKRLARRSIKE